MNLEERVLKTIKKGLKIKQEVKLENHLQDDLMLESFDILMLIAALEDEFSITINEDDFDGITIVQDVVDRLKENYE